MTPQLTPFPRVHRRDAVPLSRRALRIKPDWWTIELMLLSDALDLGDFRDYNAFDREAFMAGLIATASSDLPCNAHFVFPFVLPITPADQLAINEYVGGTINALSLQHHTRSPGIAAVRRAGRARRDSVDCVECPFITLSVLFLVTFYGLRRVFPPLPLFLHDHVFFVCRRWRWRGLRGRRSTRFASGL